MNIQDAINMVIDRIQDKREALVNAKDALFPEYGRLKYEQVHGSRLDNVARQAFTSNLTRVSSEIAKHERVIKRLDNAIEFVQGLTHGGI